MNSDVFLATLRAPYLAVLALIMCPLSVMASDVTIYTEEFPPYNFVTEDNSVVGISTDIVRHIMAEADLDYELRLMPWPRAMREAERDPQGLIFSLARTKEREGYFDWLAYLTRPEFYLFARKDDTRAVTLKAIRRGIFTAICEFRNASCMILQEAGFPADKLFRTGDGSISETAMVTHGRADLFLGDLNHHPYRLKILGLADDVAKPVLRVRRGLGLYLAAGFQVDQTLRTQVKAAHARLVARGAKAQD